MISELKNKKIGVLNGGFSIEREVSLRSGARVYEALRCLGYRAVRIDPAQEDILTSQIDVALIMLHGKFGEDGAIQSFLDFHGIPYTGSGIRASIMGINKLLTKQILLKHRLPTAPFYPVYSINGNGHPNFSFPRVLKPLDQGSSLGVDIVDTPEEFENAQRRLITQFNCGLVEEYTPGKEVTVGVLQKGASIFALPILQLKPKKRFYDYEAKYTKGLTEFILPAELSQEQTQQCQEIAKTLHQLTGCHGMSRVDMIVHPEKGPFILEINTIPGMTDLSDLPAQARHYGINYEELVEIILESALNRPSSH